ncbi:MAG: hypothetical protein ACI8SE_002192, partial [Bacteroidia bacterium]
VFSKRKGIHFVDKDSVIDKTGLVVSKKQIELILSLIIVSNFGFVEQKK